MGLKVNFSQNEATSAPREVPPSGEYNCQITDINFKEVAPGRPNAGKPYWNLKFTIVNNDKYDGGSLFSNIMLFEGKDGTLSSLSQFLKALGYDVMAGEFELPEPDDLMYKFVNVKGTKKPAGYDAKAKRDLPDRFNVTGFKPASVVGKTGDTSMLP